MIIRSDGVSTLRPMTCQIYAQVCLGGQKLAHGNVVWRLEWTQFAWLRCLPIKVDKRLNCELWCVVPGLLGSLDIDMLAASLDIDLESMSVKFYQAENATY